MRLLPTSIAKLQYKDKLSPRERYIYYNYNEWVERIRNKLESMSRGKVYGPKIESSDIVDFVTQRGGFTSPEKYKHPPEISNT